MKTQLIELTEKTFNFRKNRGVSSCDFAGGTSKIALQCFEEVYEKPFRCLNNLAISQDAHKKIALQHFEEVYKRNVQDVSCFPLGKRNQEVSFVCQ